MSTKNFQEGRNSQEQTPGNSNSSSNESIATTSFQTSRRRLVYADEKNPRVVLAPS